MAEADLPEVQQNRGRESNLIHEDTASIKSKTSQLGPEDDLVSSSTPLQAMAWYSRKRYPGALLFNIGSFLLPALYGTLSKIWVAGIDSSLVSTTDAYTYLTVVVEVFNEGLPKAVWSTIANSSTNDISTRLSLTLTLITVQSTLGFILSLSFLAAAPRFVGVFVPGPARATSVRYIRISSFSSLASTVETAVSLGTRALDQPDVPLVISTVKTFLQIILELALISTVHVRGFTPTIEVQATIRLVCDLVSASVGLVYFLSIVRKTRLRMDLSSIRWFSFSSLKVLARPGSWTFLESAVRNIIYLYLISGVVAMGQNYATAWGVFNTMRWGLVMVPVQALEATSNAFVGHRWGMWLAKPWKKASRRDIWFIVSPAVKSTFIALLVEIPLCIFLSFWAAERFAKYLSGSDEVAAITSMMWRSIDWCYICYAVSTCLATILLATRPRWYLYQSLVANLFYCLPWAIVVTKIKITQDTAWLYQKWIFGGSLVVTFVIILVVDSLWVWRLHVGKMKK